MFLLIVFVLFPLANFLLVEYWIWYPFPAVFFFHFTTIFLPLAFFALFKVVFLTVTLAGFVGLFTGVEDGVLPSTLYDFLKSLSF